MKRLISILLLSCSGSAFIAEESTIEQGNNQTTPSGGAGESQNSGGVCSQGAAANVGGSGLGRSGSDAGGPSDGSLEAGNGGATAMAGGPPMGEGGEAGYSGSSGQPWSNSPTVCLANFQNLACAKVCTNAQACDENGNCQDCQAVLSCYVSHDSLDNCTAFTIMGVSLAEQARRNCCHV